MRQNENEHRETKEQKLPHICCRELIYGIVWVVWSVLKSLQSLQSTALHAPCVHNKTFFLLTETNIAQTRQITTNVYVSILNVCESGLFCGDVTFVPAN